MTQTSNPKPARNWLRIALFASLAVNLLVIGLVVGAALRFDKGPGRFFNRMSMGLGIYVQALPDQAQGLVHGAAQKDRKAFHAAMRNSHQQVEQAILMKPYSEDRVRAALEKHRDFVVQGAVNVQDAFVTALSKLSEAEREAFFEQVVALKETRKYRRQRKHAP